MRGYLVWLNIFMGAAHQDLVMNTSTYNVVYSELHDGHLVGIRSDREDDRVHARVQLICQRVDGTYLTLHLPDVIHLRATEFLDGNVIFEFRVYDTAALTREFLFNVVVDAPESDRLLKRAREKNWIALELASSYGCVLFAVLDCRASDIRLEKDTHE